jgi:hypothetical protein
VFAYTIIDHSLPSAGNSSATVTITISPPLPAKGELYTTPFNTPRVVGPSEGILINDGSGTANCSVSVNSVSVAVPAGDGVVTGPNPTTGEFTFTPARGFQGTTTFTYGVLLVARVRDVRGIEDQMIAADAQGARRHTRMQAAFPFTSLSVPAALPPSRCRAVVQESCSSRMSTARATIEVQPPKGPLSAVDDYYVGLVNMEFIPKPAGRTILNDQRCENGENVLGCRGWAPPGPRQADHTPVLLGFWSAQATVSPLLPCMHMH